MKKRILIIDDQLIDAGVIQKAVGSCLDIFGCEYGIRTVRGPVDPEAVVREYHPHLLISDLFMTEKDFSGLSLLEQCAEMESPQGFRTLARQHMEPEMRRLATTFFWNYPGFDRYKNTLIDTLSVDGVITKDIFYLCASLKAPSLDDVERFPPLRILFQALNAVLWPVAPKGNGHWDERRLPRFLLRSLFAEASAWLSSYPHHVLEIRKSMRVDGARPVKMKYDAWNDANEIVRYNNAAPWMPCLTLESRAAKNSSAPDFYAAQMKELAEGDSWRVHVRLPSYLAMPVGAMDDWEVDWDGKQIKIEYEMRSVDRLQVNGVLRPRRAEDRYWAQLLFTLGMFSYWCHLPDHRAVLRAEEIAGLIREKTGGSGYRDIGDDSSAAEHIKEDLDMLELFLLKRIRSYTKSPWWRFIRRYNDISIIGVDKRTHGGVDTREFGGADQGGNGRVAGKADKQAKKGGFRFWLNTAFEIIPPQPSRGVR